jgi:hypothetical protein
MIWRRSSALVSKPPQRPLVRRCSLGKHHAATREQFKVAARTTGPVDRNAHRRPLRPSAARKLGYEAHLQECESAAAVSRRAFNFRVDYIPRVRTFGASPDPNC